MRSTLHRLVAMVMMFLGVGQLAADEPARDQLPAGAVARLGTMRFRQGFFLYQIAFTPSGKEVLTAGAGQGVIAWDAATGQQLRQLTDVSESQVFALSPDGRLLAAMNRPEKGKENELTLHELATGRIVRRLGAFTATALAFSADGKLLAGSGSQRGGSRAVRLWEVASGKLLHEMAAPQGWITGLAFAPEGNLLAGCDPYGPAPSAVQLFDVTSGKTLPSLVGHDKPVNAVAFSPRSKLLFSASDDQTIRAWDLESRTVRKAYSSKHGTVRALAFSGEKDHFLSGHEDGTLILWDAGSGQALREWRGHAGSVNTLGFSPDGRTIISAGMSESMPRFWNTANGHELNHQPGHAGAVDWLAVGSDGQEAWSLGREGSLLRWDLRQSTPQLIFKIAHGSFARQAVAPDHRLVAFLQRADGALTLWNTKNGQRKSLNPGSHPKPAQSFRALDVCFSPNRRLLAAASMGHVRLYEVESGMQVHDWPTGDREVALAFSPDGSVLAVAEQAVRPWEEATLRFWDTGSARALLQLEVERFPGAMAFSPDGRWLVASPLYVGDIQVWDLTTGKSATLEGTTSPAYSLAFSPDGKYLATGGAERDPKIHIWELANGKLRAHLDGKDPSVLSLAFSPDGQTLLSGSGNGTILVWDLKGKVDAAANRPAVLKTRPLLAHWPKKPPFRYPEAKHGKGELKYINDVPVLTVRGTPEEIGEQIGVLALKPLASHMDVQHVLQEVLKSHRITKAYPLLVKFCAALFYRFPAEYRREVDAMAKASGLERDLFVTMNMAPDLYRLAGCSTLIVEPGKSATGKPLFGRNLDTAPVAKLYQYSLVIVYRPEGKRAFAAMGFPGAVGPFSAINDAGLALANNSIYASADGSSAFDPRGMPIFVQCRRLMEEAATVADAEKFVRAHLPATMYSMTVCDASTGAVFELTNRTCLVRRPQDGICSCTNHFRAKGLTVTTECSRFPLLEESRKMARLNVTDVASKLNAANQGGWTLQSIVFEPADLKAHIAFGRGPTSALPFKMIDLAPLLR
jgi:isopenicillin-N N-acyltransferase like protein